jgi:hypothetical protein
MQKIKIDKVGNKKYYWNGQLLHREDGPAVEYTNGGEEWYLHGKRHREDGPAAEYANGDKHWYLHGQRHREDGPAIEWADGTKEWYLQGKEYSKKEYYRRVKLKALW